MKKELESKWKTRINHMGPRDLEAELSEHEMFKVLLKGNCHEVMQLVDHVVFLLPAAGAPAKLDSLLEYYEELKKNQFADNEAPNSASEIVVPAMVFEFVELFAALSMLPGGATLN